MGLNTSTETRVATSSKMIVAVALLAAAAGVAFLMAAFARQSGIPFFNNHSRARLTGGPVDITKHWVPVNGNVPPTILQVSGTTDSTCVLKGDGTVWCWGENSHGEFSMPTNVLPGSRTPVQIMLNYGAANPVPLTNVKQISGNCALINGSGQIWCWGIYTNQDDSRNFNPHPMLMSPGVPIAGASKILHNDYGFCFLKFGGSGYCFANAAWANNYPIRIVTAQNSLNNIFDISKGYSSTCALTDLNNSQPVWCWGENSTNQLGDGLDPGQVSGVNENSRDTYGHVMDGNNRPGPEFGGQKLATNAWSSCMIDRFGSVACWGQCNIDKQNQRLGNFMPGDGNCSNAAFYFPDQIGKKFSGMVDIAGSGEHYCTVKNDGTMWCWGLNDMGQLGDGTRINSWKAPVQVNVAGVPIVDMTSVFAAANHTCAVYAGFAVACWGGNTHDVLGTACNQARCSTPGVITF